MKIRFGSRVAFTVPSAAVTLAMVVGGCGGIVKDSDESDGGGYDHRGSGGKISIGSGGSVATGASKGTGAKPLPGTGGSVSKPACGNGRLDPGESCDGSIVGTTCSNATMGSRPTGTVTCSKTCTWDTTGCRSANVGGFPGTGGVTGTGGRPATGGVTYDSCLSPTTPTILPNACTAPCGCKACPETYAACRADGGCSWILACAQQQGCASVAQCYSTACSSIINTSGGLMSLGSRLADPTLACLAQSGCGVACR